MKNILTSLRIYDCINEKNDAAMALAKVYKLIFKLPRQVPPSHRGYTHRIELLRKEAIGQDWSSEPLYREATHGLTFQQLYGDLEAVVQLDKESRFAILRDLAGHASRDRSYDAVAINCHVQGRYKHPLQSVQTRFNDKNPKSDPLSLMGCYNCDSPGHMARECSHPKNFAKSAARKLEYFSNKKTPNSVHVFLSYLCQQMDQDKSDVEDDTGSPANDSEIFHSVISHGHTHDDYTYDSPDNPVDIF